MSYEDDDLYDDDNENEPEQQSQKNPLRAQIKRLERENKALKERAENGDKAARDLEFVKAGVPVDDPKAKWFLKGYDGEVNAEAIKAAAAEAGLIEADEEQQTDAIPPEERAAHQRIAGTSTGGGSTNAVDAFDAAIAEAKTAGNHQRVIELKQQKSAAARAR